VRALSLLSLCALLTGCGSTDAAPDDGGTDVTSDGDLDTQVTDTLPATDATDTGAADSGPGDAVVDVSPGALVNPAPGSGLFIGANFWNIDWEGQDDYFVKGTDFATATNPWRPELLTDLAPYKVLRFMDWNGTNEKDNPQAVWSTRKQKTAAQSNPVAFEWQIDLCNRAKKDYWLTVPHAMSPADWTKLANLVKDQLDPSLRLYLEWSNEVWNGGFPQHAYAAAQGKALGLAGSDPAASYQAYTSVRLFEAFEAVFGKGSPRLVKVLSGQAAWTGPCDAMVKALADAKINPLGTKPGFYAIAPYFSGISMSALTAASTTAAGWTKESGKCAASGAMTLISYEGGADAYAASSCTTLQHDAGMRGLYSSYLDAQAGAGLKGPFMQYTHTGACWGLKQKTGDAASSSPKYQGVLDWIAAHP